MSGAIPSPHAAWALYRGLETLELRFSRMCDTAEKIAPMLAAHPAVQSARFPGLPTDPSHNLAAAQMARFGFLIGLDLGTEDRAERFINECCYLRPATSFGGYTVRPSVARAGGTMSLKAMFDCPLVANL